jgi:winged helix-turn helix protein
MQTFKLRFPIDALPTLDTFSKQTKEARICRCAQAVRHVVKGQRLQVVSDALSFTYSALRKWAYRFTNQGVQGLVDRPRSGRPPKVTCASNSTSIASLIKTQFVAIYPSFPRHLLVSNL